VKPRTIDDVPILALTLHSRRYDHLMLRRVAAQLDDAVKSVPSVAETTLIGGLRRAVNVEFDPAAAAARGLSVEQLIVALQQSNRETHAGSRPFGNRQVVLDVGNFLRSAKEVEDVVVGVHASRPVYLRDVARVRDEAGEPGDYVLHGVGAHQAGAEADLQAAVTLTVSKRPDTNAVRVVNDVMAKVDTFAGTLLPGDVKITLTRDYGHTAAEKSNELLLHMGIAVFGVALLILFFLGWRESVVVLLAIPSTLALTLLVFYFYG
jgi:multidrug efflux pump subunit AcrB